MDTIETRKAIGFLDDRKDWSKAEAVYDEHTLRIAGHPVMEDWELGYMAKLAQVVTRNGGRVLELGFGMGLSAKAIQAAGIRDHYAIECHPGVVKHAADIMESEIGANSFHLLTGFWEDITPLLADNTFDGILFDTYPLTEEEVHANHFWFFKEAHRLLKPGGIFTYYSDEASDYSDKHIKKLLEAGFECENIKGEVCPVSPPADCEYWQEKSFLVPIITK